MSYYDINRVFRSVTYQIILKRNDFSIIIIKSGAQTFQVDVMHLSWMLPVLHPNLPIATQFKCGLTKKLEQFKSGLGKGSSFELRWEACNTFKSDNKMDKYGG